MVTDLDLKMRRSERYSFLKQLGLQVVSLGFLHNSDLSDAQIGVSSDFLGTFVTVWDFFDFLFRFLALIALSVRMLGVLVRDKLLSGLAEKAEDGGEFFVRFRLVLIGFFDAVVFCAMLLRRLLRKEGFWLSVSFRL